MDVGMARTHQNFILEREPHQLKERFALLNRENVGAIHPLPMSERPDRRLVNDWWLCPLQYWLPSHLRVGGNACGSCPEG